MQELHFIYLVSDKWKEHLRYEWLYVYKMARFYQWWIKKNFRLNYNVKSSVILVSANRFTRWRFGLSDIIRDHKNKGENNYHIYLSYFKPLASDCSVGYYINNLGVVKWDYYNNKHDPTRFLALENCPKVSHIILHEIANRARKEIRKRYHEDIHEQWLKYIYRKEDYEYYNDKYEKVSSNSNYAFATMKVSKQDFIS